VHSPVQIVKAIWPANSLTPRSNFVCLQTTHQLHQSKDLDSERTSRLRDNKRRHRARKKEYVQDLESKLAEYREQGVLATKEVQVAAQKVIRENAKLREMLRQTGYSAEDIDNWVNQDGSGEHGLGTTMLNEVCLDHPHSRTSSLRLAGDGKLVDGKFPGKGNLAVSV
jgi:hypothetical protein